MIKILTVYFSLTGTTRRVAQMIASASNSELIELKVQPGMFGDGMNGVWPIAQRQLANHDLPEIVSPLPNFDDYDLVLVGGPTWGYQPATPVRSLLKAAQGSRTAFAPFYTSTGQAGEYEPTFKRLAGSLRVLPGLGTTGSTGQMLDQRIAAWLSQIEK
ncbi:flavodoxin [Lacticaseibacillus pabuli]|uniref:Flavodoxin n=1 Tax=Lacticaseibacillus pabuli TaxID=3025672 RepID=A0ABY7WQZ6_9LACO|nr:flavodoxin [Lacticaseibacillus sp. KACC 23028]WDF81575.1 flavodoxin [Lacticaseibacillus sp. KACC 23028]